MRARDRKRRVSPLAAGLAIVLPLAACAVLGPALANDRPLFSVVDGHPGFPALGQLPLIGPLFERPGYAAIDWTRHPGDHPVPAPVPHHFAATDLEHRFMPPGRSNLLGTDALGRDLLARLIRASRVSLSIGLLSTLMAFLIAMAVGSAAGWFSGVTDTLVSRLIEVVLCFPVLFFVLAVIGLDPPALRRVPDMGRLALLFGLTGWTGMARHVRAECLRLRKTDFIAAARASGAGNLRIIVRHLLPNSVGPALVAASFFVSQAILLEAAISFLGFGIQPPEPSWGSMLNEAQESIASAWWMALFPGGALFLTVLGFNLAGEGIRSRLDRSGAALYESVAPPPGSRPEPTGS